MATVTIEVPDDAFAVLRRSPKELAQEMRLLAAIHWYRKELISQGKAAELAGLSRGEFLEALFREQVPACQVTIDELEEELRSWPVSSGESSMPLP